ADRHVRDELHADGRVLVRVRDGRAVVAGVTEAVEVGVLLILVRDGRAVVAGVAQRILVGVRLARVRDRGAVVAGVPDTVTVAVLLLRVGDRRAIVRRVGYAVPVGILDAESRMIGEIGAAEPAGRQPQRQIGAGDPVGIERHVHRRPVGRRAGRADL